MNTQEIVAKLWNLCNVLRDDGITYHQYVTELTYILFLKMAKETGSEENIPEGYRWDDLLARKGLELKGFYKNLLDYLGERCTGRIQEIYKGAATNIDEPKNLEKIIRTIDELNQSSSSIVLIIFSRLSGRLTSWTGSARRRRALVIFTRDCWKRTLTKRRAAQDSILRRAC